MQQSSRLVMSAVVLGTFLVSFEAAAQGPNALAATATPPAAAAPLPDDYVIGPDDVLTVTFWRDEAMSGEVVVRPDGKIALPLLNDVQAAGLTPEQLRDALVASAKQFVADPNATVVVKQINSRKVFITGMVERPGSYPLTSTMNVMQLIALAGGLKEFSKPQDIVVMRSDNGQQVAYPFNYKEILKGRRLHQNIDLKPGDTVVIP
jgi:polysaccharide biosynthesis/export protein